MSKGGVRGWVGHAWLVACVAGRHAWHEMSENKSYVSVT